MPQPVRDGLADVRAVLADAAAEGERVEPAEHGRHRRDGLREAVGEVRRSASASSSPPSAASPDSSFSARSSSSSGTPARRRYRSAPGSTEPERVAIGTPSSGVKPIVVSTERPSSTAVTEQPPPRWQTTSRGRVERSATDSTASPWKPMPDDLRSSRAGSA